MAEKYKLRQCLMKQVCAFMALGWFLLKYHVSDARYFCDAVQIIAALPVIYECVCEIEREREIILL